MTPQERIKELEEALEMVKRFLNRDKLFKYSYLKGPDWKRDVDLAIYFVERVLEKK
jgi:hypothetical protein